MIIKHYRLIGIWFDGGSALRNEFYDNGGFTTQEEAEKAVTTDLFKEDHPDFIIVVPAFKEVEKYGRATHRSEDDEGEESAY